MLIYRVLSAVVLVPIAAWTIYRGGLWFFALVVLAAGLGGYEFFRMMAAGGYKPSTPLGLVLILLLLVDARYPLGLWARFSVAAVIILSLIWHLFTYKGEPPGDRVPSQPLEGEKDEMGGHPPSPPPWRALFRREAATPTVDWALTLAGSFYIGWTAAHLVSLRELPAGMGWVFLTFLSTCVGDAGAYFIGGKWGHHRLFPRLSPGKSWEGAVGGWLCTVMVTVLAGFTVGLDVVHGLLLGAAMATINPFGDLAVSMMKREMGVKDSGRIIPGHGGVLDRIDTLLFSVVVVYYYATLVIATG